MYIALTGIKVCKSINLVNQLLGKEETFLMGRNINQFI